MQDLLLTSVLIIGCLIISVFGRFADFILQFMKLQGYSKEAIKLATNLRLHIWSGAFIAFCIIGWNFISIDAIM